MMTVLTPTVMTHQQQTRIQVTLPSKMNNRRTIQSLAFLLLLRLLPAGTDQQLGPEVHPRTYLTLGFPISVQKQRPDVLLRLSDAVSSLSTAKTCPACT
jgi:hypothetical protein